MMNRVQRRASEARSEWADANINDQISKEKRRKLFQKKGRVFRQRLLEAIKAQEDSNEVRQADRDVESHHGGYNPR